MDFDLPAELRELQQRTRQFIAEQVIPLEGDPRAAGGHGPSEDLRRELVARARAAGLLTPHASRHLGGLGLSHLAKAVVFEEAGYSRLGPTAMNWRVRCCSSRSSAGRSKSMVVSVGWAAGRRDLDCRTMLPYDFQES